MFIVVINQMFINGFKFKIARDVNESPKKASKAYLVLSKDVFVIVRRTGFDRVVWTMHNKDKTLKSGSCVFEGDETIEWLLDSFLCQLVEDWHERRR